MISSSISPPLKKRKDSINRRFNFEIWIKRGKKRAGASRHRRKPGWKLSPEGTGKPS